MRASRFSVELKSWSIRSPGYDRRLYVWIADARQGIVLKIETKLGFENLPAMLLEALKAPRCGVMIARGDLAVECGFERLAEVQEEILWLCEAAHVPVIWATQVLESSAEGRLAFTGRDYRRGEADDEVVTMYANEGNLRQRANIVIPALSRTTSGLRGSAEICDHSDVSISKR